MKATEETGVLIQFLPPYSLDFNPIEEALSKVKTAIKLLEEMMTLSLSLHLLKLLKIAGAR